MSGNEWGIGDRVTITHVPAGSDTKPWMVGRPGTVVQPPNGDAEWDGPKIAFDAEPPLDYYDSDFNWATDEGWWVNNGCVARYNPVDTTHEVW